MKAFFFAFFLLLLAGQSIVFSLPLWLDVQQVTSSYPGKEAIAKATFHYFAEGDRAVIPSLPDFTKKENTHMRDVKVLIDIGQLLLFLSLLVWFALCSRDGRFTQSVFQGSAGLMIFLLLLAVLPFETLFIWFHRIFFTAGSWQFSSGAMISSFTRPFFAYLAQLWWLRAFFTAALLCLGSFALLRRQRTAQH